MNNLFSKRKSGTTSKSYIPDKGIKKSYEQLKRCWANWMNDQTKSFTRQRWMVLLFLFIISISTISIYIMIDSFQERETNLIVITPIRKPNHILETGEANIGTKSLAGEDYNHVKEIRNCIDSLIKSPSEKIVLDSIMIYHPALKDRLRFMENYFQQLNVKKWKSE